MRKLIAAVITCTALFGVTMGPALAEGQHNGWDSQSTGPNNGNSSNSNGNLDNNGTTSSETTGPKGQLDKGNTDCNNCETIVNLPGKNR